MVELINQDEKKFVCPFCGYEMKKSSKRCENCASILDISVENKDSDDLLLEDETEKNILKDTPIVNQEEKSSLEEPSFESEQKESNEVKQPLNYQPIKPKYTSNLLVPPAPRPLTNAIKVLLTTACVIIPIIGQFVGLIISIIYMNSDEELKDCEDRRSFGLALLIACVIAFLIACFGGFILLLTLASRYTY